MNIKILALCITTSLTLAACGGSGSSKNENSSSNSSENTTGHTPGNNNANTPDNNSGNTNPPTGNTENSTVTTYAAYYYPGIGTNVAKETIKIVGNTLYSDRTGNVALIPQIADHYLTKDHHYDIPSEKTQYGYEIGTVQRLNNQWIQTPYSSKNYNQLTITDTVKNIQLDGKLLAEYIDNDFFQYQQSSYMALFKDAKFGRGAECIKIESSTASEEYVTTPFYYISSYTSVKDYYGGRPTQEKLFAGFKVHLNADPLVDEDQDALIELDGKFYAGDLNKAGKNYESDPNVNECSLFNEEAQKSIGAIIEKYKQ